MKIKSPLKSITLWFNFLAFLSLLYPPSLTFVSNNPDLIVTVLTLSNFIMRIHVKKVLQLF
jgi:hypothetical protein